MRETIDTPRRTPERTRPTARRASRRDGAPARRPTPLTIAGRTLRSRLLLGTGGFPSLALLAEAIAASGSELVTVALRRVDPARAARCSTCSPTRAWSCCRTPPAATPRATPC